MSRIWLHVPLSAQCTLHGICTMEQLARLEMEVHACLILLILHDTSVVRMHETTLMVDAQRMSEIRKSADIAGATGGARVCPTAINLA